MLLFARMLKMYIIHTLIAFVTFKELLICIKSKFADRIVCTPVDGYSYKYAMSLIKRSRQMQSVYCNAPVLLL